MVIYTPIKTKSDSTYIPEQSLLNYVMLSLSLLVLQHMVEDPQRTYETLCLLSQEVGPRTTSEPCTHSEEGVN